MTNKDLADLIFPNITKTIEDYEKIYPSRNNQVVTRIAIIWMVVKENCLFQKL